MPDTTPVTVAGMLRRIAAGRAELDALLASHSRTPAGAWSAKDHMAHIACWERSGLALLNGEDRLAHVGLARDAHESLGIDGVNDHIHAFYSDMEEAEVRALYDETHAAQVTRLERMSDDDLHLPYSHYQPNDPPYNARPVWHWIAGNTYEHYAEHLEILTVPSERGRN